MSEIGKISGQILADDLTRQGTDLVFDTDLLYLDVVNRRVGVKNTGPTTGFLVSGDIKSDYLSVVAPNISPNFTTIGSLKFYGNTIQNAVGDINLTATGSTKYVYAKAWRSSTGLEFRGSDLQGTGTDQSINLYPTGTGTVVVGQVGTEKDLAVNGNLRTTGTLTFGGDVTFGNSDSDNITFSSDINSNIRPEQPGATELWSLGQPGYTWNNLYSKNVTVDNASFSGSLGYGTIDISLTQGKSWYVAVNGSNTNAGDHQQGPYLTIAKALSVAQSGDTIFVFPGTYAEVTPLIVPVGVTVRGLDIRTVIVQPDPSTISNDIFLLNGETTLEDFTVTGFRYNSLANTGHAFRFANNFKVTSRSPYVKNITVITTGSSVGNPTTTAGAMNYSANGLSAYFFRVYGPLHNDPGHANFDQVQPGWTCDQLPGSVVVSNVPDPADNNESCTITITGGTFVQNTFYTFTGPSDPRGYFSYDAGRAAYIDGAVATSDSKEASLLFHSCTFLTPGVDCVTMINGVRVEWLNSFTYFAERGLVGLQGETGRLAQIGATVNLYIPNSPLLRTTANLESFFRVTQTSWEASGLSIGAYLTNPVQFAPGTTVTDVQGPDTFDGQDYYIIFTSTNPLVDLNPNDLVTVVTDGEVKFGAELRSIGSANVYGNWATWGDGANVIMYLVGHNFAYIGSLQDSSNDPTLAEEGHEAERLNGAEIYYQSLNQSGDMRIGNVFKVNGETGAVTFAGTNFQVNQGSIEFTNSSSRTYLDAHEVSTGNIRISGNTITTTSGDLILSAANQDVNISSISEFILPKGSNTDPFNTVGGARFNTTINNFEGYAATGVVSLYAVGDSTRTTRITPELTPGASDQTIRMYANNDLKISITDSLVSIKNLDIGNLKFNTSDTVSLVGNNDLTLVPTSGIVTIQDLNIYTDTIENTSDNDILTFPQNDDGFVVVSGTKALQVPYGTDVERTVTEVGMHRFNTDSQLLEVWNGIAWVPAVGSSAVTTEDMIEESGLWTFVLG
jgi:hypothetical protein